ncbi:MAG: SGNH/GDSL hydrolase family protein [Treponema sp.]|nr:SGNH/GDSL hydrolase family protein [Treponema sp.]
MSCDNSVEQKTALGCTEEQYQKNIENSLISKGSQAYMEGVTTELISKLQKGETVYVAAIGGSVTEGAGADQDKAYYKGYAYQFKDMLKEKYPKADIKFFGAGLSGTPSLLGVIRYKKDVEERLGHTPNLLILEFSVNDSGNETFARSYEGIIRTVLLENPKTTIISLYADAKSYKNCQGTLDPVAEYYGLPRLSIQNAVENPSSGIDEEKFFFDYVHPETDGHTFMAKCLMNVISLLEENAAAGGTTVYELPESPKFANSFYNIHPLYSNTSDENVKITAGSFSDKDANSQSLKIGGNEFPNNWHHTNGSESFKMTLTCKSLIFVYKHQGSWLSEKEPFGKAEVYVDGVKIKAHADGKEEDTFNGAKDGSCFLCCKEKAS